MAPRVAVLALAAAAFAHLVGAAASTPAAHADPFVGAKLYVDPRSKAAEQAGEWLRSRPADAAALRKIARQPQADWFGDWNSDLVKAVHARLAQIQGARRLPVFVAYDIPVRDCGNYSAGGAPTPAAYRSWIDEFAGAVGGAKVVVILEPDALPAVECLTAAEAASRVSLIHYAVDRLTAQPRVSVYLDAGNSRWRRVDDIVPILRAAGVAKARGFSLNVSNFAWTRDEIAYGRAISRRLGGKHFVLDTSRNGRGPLPQSQWKKDEDGWCNPWDRALGRPPSVQPGVPLVDAFLWVKHPGESDGTCNGGPPSGEWWPDYALGLARRARW